MGILNIKRNKLNLSGFVNIEKGVYKDNYQNRKLGRVGMTYKTSAKTVEDDKKGYAKSLNDIDWKETSKGKEFKFSNGKSLVTQTLSANSLIVYNEKGELERRITKDEALKYYNSNGKYKFSENSKKTPKEESIKPKTSDLNEIFTDDKEKIIKNWKPEPEYGTVRSGMNKVYSIDIDGKIYYGVSEYIGMSFFDSKEKMEDYVVYDSEKSNPLSKEEILAKINKKKKESTSKKSSDSTYNSLDSIPWKKSSTNRFGNANYSFTKNGVEIQKVSTKVGYVYNVGDNDYVDEEEVLDFVNGKIFLKDIKRSKDIKDIIHNSKIISDLKESDVDKITSYIRSSGEDISIKANDSLLTKKKKLVDFYLKSADLEDESFKGKKEGLEEIFEDALNDYTENDEE